MARLRDELADAVRAAEWELRDSNFLQEEMTEAASFLATTIGLLKGVERSDDCDLRSQIAIVHARIRRMPLKKDDALRVWASFRELQDKLEHLDAAASIAGFAEVINPLGFHPQILLPRSVIIPEVEALTSKLGELDNSLQQLSSARSPAPAHHIQNDLIDYAVERVGSNSAIARALADESSVDVAGVYRSVGGIGRTALAFKETIDHPSAVITPELIEIAPTFAHAAAEAAKSGDALTRRAKDIQSAIVRTEPAGEKETGLAELIDAVARMDMSARTSSAILLEHDCSAPGFVSELACQLLLRGQSVVVPQLKQIPLWKEMDEELRTTLIASYRLREIEWSHIALTEFMKTKTQGFARFIVVLATQSYIRDVLEFIEVSDRFVKYTRRALVVYLQEDLDVSKYGILRRELAVGEEKLIHGAGLNSAAAADRISEALRKLRSTR